MKQIIVLETFPLPGGVSQVNCLFWFPVIPGREIPRPGATTVFRTASTAEVQAIQQGTVVEEAFQHHVPPSTPQATVQTQLQAIYANRKAAFDAKPNPNQFYGLAWDGAAWA